MGVWVNNGTVELAQFLRMLDGFSKKQPVVGDWI
jgi:hypothetical protein